MTIKETKTMPHPSGFGWGTYSQVRALKDGETVPPDAETVPDDSPKTGWVSETLAFETTADAPIALPGGAASAAPASAAENALDAHSSTAPAGGVSA